MWEERLYEERAALNPSYHISTLGHWFAEWSGSPAYVEQGQVIQLRSKGPNHPNQRAEKEKIKNYEEHWELWIYVGNNLVKCMI